MPDLPETPEEMRHYLSANPPKPQLPWHRLRAQLYFVRETAERCHSDIKNHPNHWFATAANVRSLLDLFPLLQTQVHDLVKFLNEDFPRDNSHQYNDLFEAAQGAVMMLQTAVTQFCKRASDIADTILRELEKRTRASSAPDAPNYFSAEFAADVKRLKVMSYLGDELRDVSKGISCLSESFAQDMYAYW